MTGSARTRVLFLLFLLSGFCGLVYQVVWLRLAFASFGITTPVLSIVVSVFMLGLGLGAALAGNWVSRRRGRPGVSALAAYAWVELGIGTGAFAVPALLRAGADALLPAGTLDSVAYHALSGVVLAAVLLPWCTLMGATFPLVMEFVRETDAGDGSSFSFLYLANVLGAALGTAGTALVLVESLGFSGTLVVAGTLNAAAALIAFAASSASRRASEGVPESPSTAAPPRLDTFSGAALFTTGFCSMAFEVVWTRSYTPVLRTVVYSFAALLAVYLVATSAGSWLYRRGLRGRAAVSVASATGIVALASVAPLFTADPRVLGIAANVIPSKATVLLGIVPFCAALGYLTPQLVDRCARGDPRLAGRAYAVNVAGCVAGPLVAGHLLLPAVGGRATLVALVAPLVALQVAALAAEPSARRRGSPMAVVTVGLSVFAAFAVRTFEEGAHVKSQKVVRRDSTATVISHGTGLQKKLLVNGIGMTAMDPCTKFMAHLPMGCHPRPERALVICLGMGATFRSLHSWGADVTAVELVPSVRDAFPYYFDDAGEVLASGRARVVVDDGRRFLRRTRETFDVVTLDPPPPVEAAGSSLLYTDDFYRLVKARLRPGGILHVWFPGMPADDGTYGAVLRTLADEFPSVRVFESTKPRALHYLASMSAIDVPIPEDFVARMPEAARSDLVEWNDPKDRDPLVYVRSLLARELDAPALISASGDRRITDDRPFNEYYLLRRWRTRR